MCGRFILISPAREIAEHFSLVSDPEFNPRYNIAPTQEIATVRLDPETNGKILQSSKWGLVPFWAKDTSVGGANLINARCETVRQKPAFRAAFKSRRCLIPANGFYEWMKVEKRKQPYLIQLADRSLFAFAGLWDHWEGKGQVLETCAIITTESNDLLKPIHDRMPVIIPRKDYDSWLNPEETAENLCRPYPSGEMTCFPVGLKVNKAGYDQPDCIEPDSSQS